MPAASSSVTNISEMTTATSTPKTSSDAPEPWITCSFTRTGLEIDARIGSETSRFSAASRAKRETCSSALRDGSSLAMPAIAASMIACALRSPRMFTSPTTGSDSSPPATIRFR
jgi:hypothetical protein